MRKRKGVVHKVVKASIAGGRGCGGVHKGVPGVVGNPRPHRLRSEFGLARPVRGARGAAGVFPGAVGDASGSVWKGFRS